MSTLPKEYLQLAKEFIAFKSISTDIAYKDECEKTAQWLIDLFSQHNFDVQTIQGPTTNPVVIARYVADPSFETVMVYGHYDVQPADRDNGWDSDPFELTQTPDRLIARGAIDNKGQVMVHIHTVIELIKENALGYNVVFMIEGNEETGNPDMPGLVKQHADMMQCDHIMVSDGETLKDKPTIEQSLRGGGSMLVKLTTGKNNLHSGLFGGAVPNAIHELSKVLSSLFTEDNKVAAEGFYNGVDDISSEILEQNKNMMTDQEAIELAGVKALTTEGGEYDYLTQVGLRPTIQITGIQGGYTGEGFANIVVAQAFVKINVRTVASQDADAVMQAIKNHIHEHTPEYADLVVQARDAYPAIKLDTSAPIVQEVAELLEQAYGEKPVNKFVGGGIPIVGDFQEVLGKETLLVSFANEDCNMHGVHENFKIELLEKALKFSRLFFEKR